MTIIYKKCTWYKRYNLVCNTTEFDTTTNHCSHKYWYTMIDI